MQFDLRQTLRMAVATLLVALFIVPTDALAQSHVVSPADLQKAATAASQVRQHNLDSIQRLLSTPTAEKALKSAKMDTQQVKTAVSTLNDQELAQLAARADKAQADFSAGDLSERDLILIILGIAVLVLIIVAVRQKYFDGTKYAAETHLYPVSLRLCLCRNARRLAGRSFHQAGKRWLWSSQHRRSEERRVGKEWRSRWSP